MEISKVPKEGIVSDEITGRNEYYIPPLEVLTNAFRLYESRNPNSILFYNSSHEITDTEFIKIVLNSFRRHQYGNTTPIRGMEEELPENASRVFMKCYNDGHVELRFDLVNCLAEYKEQLRRPLNMDEVFVLFLEDSGGNIAKAIESAHSFFKAIARNQTEENLQEGKVFTREEAENWLKNTTSDSLGIMKPYNELTESVSYKGADRVDHDKSLRGQVGRPYHFYAILELLNTFSPFQVATLVMGEYLYEKGHGLHKFISDLNIVLSIKEINNLLNSYNKNERINSIMG